ncbi:hypothetical protein F4561_006195 [Lipingzhangella halophila]|uniref:Uncharacterized protein n=1 Tax=Lipingzhangella halophila TaxID=1783352 RepID=A0A7W7RNM9_9ACTN|nr:hypothetical protein [Lipingzhangella halophila]MBB4935301.1 hypothetical protein [Lipingzhangella halophila]
MFGAENVLSVTLAAARRRAGALAPAKGRFPQNRRAFAAPVAWVTSGTRSDYWGLAHPPSSLLSSGAHPSATSTG